MNSNRRSSLYKELINSRRWRNLRDSVLAASPLCADCMSRERRRTAATEVHHIEPVTKGANRNAAERLMFAPSNLVPLCHGCHVLRHRELDSHSRTRRKELQRTRLEARLAELSAPCSADDNPTQRGPFFEQGGGTR